jgi:hypothetical protein
MFLKRAAVLFLALSFALGSPLGTTELPEAHLKTTSVAAFKNGLGFFIRQGQVSSATGEGRILSVPLATMGTLWLVPNDPGASLDELVAYRQTANRLVPAPALTDLLRLNVGKVVTVTYNGQPMTGMIVSFSDSTAKPAASPDPATASPQVLLLRSEGKIIAMNLGGVSQVLLSEQSQWNIQTVQEIPALRFKLIHAPESARLTMGYLQKGFGWTPSYLVTLEDEKTARILLQSVVTNDAEDLQDAEIFFVVGVPNFRFSEVLSPMAIQQTIAQYMDDVRRSGFQGGIGGGVGGNANAVFSQLIMNGRNVSSGNEADADLRAAVAELEGAPEEDLFLYRRAHTTLARGERATYNVFNMTIPYEHIYEWEIPDTTYVDPFGNAQQNYNQSPPDRARESANDVWHSLRLTNATQFPWTSAPSLTMSNNQPIAQDVLPYTPRGAHTSLKLTIATDVRPQREELEVERQVDALHAHGNSYDAVTVEGTLKIKNYKSKEIRLFIGKTLTGSMLSISDAGKSKRLAVAVQAENPTSRLDWDLKLKPQEEKTIVYRYKVLVRR